MQIDISITFNDYIFSTVWLVIFLVWSLYRDRCSKEVNPIIAVAPLPEPKSHPRQQRRRNRPQVVRPQHSSWEPYRSVSSRTADFVGNPLPRPGFPNVFSPVVSDDEPVTLSTENRREPGPEPPEEPTEDPLE